MKTPTENLERDHVYVLKVTDIMEAIALTDQPNVDHIQQITDIIKNFADGIHHAKEEELLFPAMGLRGFSPAQGPVAVMLHEHAEGRNFVKGINDNLRLYLAGERNALPAIYSNMLGYANLLRNHISKENNILFRMADNSLGAGEQAELLAEFARIENSLEPGSRVEDYIERINLLAAYYKV